jgi:hypothetical protein
LRCHLYVPRPASAGCNVISTKQELIPVYFLVHGVAAAVFAVLVALYWSRVSRLGRPWSWIGVALWFIALAAKLQIHRLRVSALIARPFLDAAFTLLVAFIWPKLGQDANHAISVSVGAAVPDAFTTGVGLMFVGMVNDLLVFGMR